MLKRLLLGIVIACQASLVSAQTLSDGFVDSLEKQGFEIQSVGRTWLFRTLVVATDGTHRREIVIARGSGQILQDNWTRLSEGRDGKRGAKSRNGNGRIGADRSRGRGPSSSSGGQGGGENGRDGGGRGGGGGPGGRP